MSFYLLCDFKMAVLSLLFCFAWSVHFAPAPYYPILKTVFIIPASIFGIFHTITFIKYASLQNSHQTNKHKYPNIISIAVSKIAAIYNGKTSAASIPMQNDNAINPACLQFSRRFSFIFVHLNIAYERQFFLLQISEFIFY